MKVLLNKELGPIQDCPYIPENKSCNEFFLAYNLSKGELDEFLEDGWRKFGIYFYRPKCPNCESCLPLRVLTNQFNLSKGHKKILRTNRDIEVKIQPLEYRDEIFELYSKHSRQRFGQDSNSKEFRVSHFFVSCPSIQMEYFLGNKLVAVGFLDIGKQSLSSVYFIFDPDFSKRSLGIFGALFEIEYAQKASIPYYYLGYFISSNSSMTYKSQFTPYEIYHWGNEEWRVI
jgi:arginine-tRNA-protein transferase